MVLLLILGFAKSFEHAKAYGFLGNIDETVLFGNLEKLIEVIPTILSEKVLFVILAMRKMRW